MADGILMEQTAEKIVKVVSIVSEGSENAQNHNSTPAILERSNDIVRDLTIWRR